MSHDLSPAEYSQLERALAGSYSIDRVIGRGGMATVYLAKDLRHRRSVAIKVLHPTLAHEVGADRFSLEIEIAAGLQHPNIVPLHDSGKAGNLLYYVMPYVDGESLRQRIEREGQLPTDAAIAIAGDVARALDYAHAHGVVHRDIKPANVLLAGSAALVTDFGVARAVAATDRERLTASGMVLGTPAYMSPEQAGGHRRIDGRSDVYSLACVVYEMLSGEPPFTGATPQAILARHMHAPVPSLRVVRDTITPNVQRVLERALAKTPSDRFATPGEFVRALGALPEKTVSWRRRLVVAAAVAAFLLPLAAMLVRGGGTPPAASPVGAMQTIVDPPRIAVLYFDNLTPDSTLDRFANRLTEALIHELSGVKAFRVVSRSGVEPYRGRRIPFDSMVAALRVNTVVDGSVQRSGNRLRVRAQLIDAASNTYVDSLSLERQLGQQDDLERGIALELAAALRRQMGREVRLRTARAGTGNPLAMELTFTARRAREDAAVMAEQPHAQDIRAAIAALMGADSMLARAQVADATWLRPLLDRGWVAHELARLARGEPRLAAARRGLGYAEEAVRRAPTSAEALALRGSLRWHLVTELQSSADDPDRLHKVERDLRAALATDSTLARAWAALSDVLWYKGSTAEAGIAARRALQEDPYLADALGIFHQLFFDDLMLGRYDQAAEWCTRGHLTFPRNWRFVECELTLMRHDQGVKPDPERAWALVEELEQLDPAHKAKADGREYHTIYRRVVAGAISARAGRRDVARAELARARRATEGDSVLRLDLAYDEAYLRLVLGERERAAELLRSYVDARPMTLDYLTRDPLFGDLEFTSAKPSP